MSKPFRKTKPITHRKLSDLRSVGPATISDLRLLGITTVEELTGKDAQELYERLCIRTGATHDPCVIDVFQAAIEQATDPSLERRKCNWWYWTKVRKQTLK